MTLLVISATSLLLLSFKSSYRRCAFSKATVDLKTSAAKASRFDARKASIRSSASASCCFARETSFAMACLLLDRKTSIRSSASASFLVNLSFICFIFSENSFRITSTKCIVFCSSSTFTSRMRTSKSA